MGMDRFSIPCMDVDMGSESLAEAFSPNGTRVIPKVTEVMVRPRAGTGVSLIARATKHRRKTIAAVLASLACLGTLFAIYGI